MSTSLLAAVLLSAAPQPPELLARVAPAHLTPGFAALPADPIRGDGVGLRRHAWIPLTVGTVFTVGGGICLNISNEQLETLQTGTNLTPGQVDAARDRGTYLQTAGIIGLSVGGAALITGVVFWLTGDERAPALVAVPTRHGVAFGWGGSF